MLAYGVLVSCACAPHAAQNMTTRAMPLNALVLTLFRSITSPVAAFAIENEKYRKLVYIDINVSYATESWQDTLISILFVYGRSGEHNALDPRLLSVSSRAAG